MGRLIPLGFLGGAPIRPFTFDTSVATGSTNFIFGGAYAPLANAKWFIFHAASNNTATTNYRYTNNANPSTGWATGTMPSSARWGQAASSGTRIVAANTGDNGTVGAYSDNGTTWTSTTIWSTTQQTTRVIHDGTRFLALGTSQTTQNLATSSDGATWARILLASTSFRDIAYDGSSTYIALASGSGLSEICTSNPTVAGNWTQITGLTLVGARAIAYGNGVWVAIRDNGSTSYATSTNGTTWTARTFAVAPSSSGDFTKITFHNGYFYYQSSATAIYSSPDGITWTAQTTPTIGTPIRGWPTDGNFMLALGGSSATIAIGRK